MSYLTKVQTVQKEITVGLECDICGATTDDEDDSQWTDVSHSHSNWGNDSCESFQTFHICSPQCYIAQLVNSVRSLEYRDSGEINNMPLKFVVNLLRYIGK